ncbi:MAG: hypothetical protein ACWGHO_04160 [Candidatus Moraniibacteriota bacterium]
MIKKIIKKARDFFKSKKFEKSKIIIFILGTAFGISVGNYFLVYAENFIDSFLDTSRVANTWNVEVDTANGEVKLAQRSCDNSVWFCDMTWRCPGTVGDGNGLLVKRTDLPVRQQWKIWANACDTPECGQDGVQLGDKLSVDNTIDFSAYYPARQACKAIGARLPTISELQCIYAYRGSFGNNFLTSYVYWSSEESSTSANARGVYFYNNAIYDESKSSSQNVRCVRGW